MLTVPQSMLTPSSILQLDHAVPASDAIAQPPWALSQASDLGTIPSHIHPVASDAAHCQHAYDLAAVLGASEARLADRLFFIENSLAQRMSSAESRIADLAKHAFNLSSPAPTTRAPTVARGNAGPPSPCSAMTQCEGSFPSPPTFDGTTSWSVFLRQFESAAALCAWPEQHKARILVTQLRSPAAEF